MVTVLSARNITMSYCRVCGKYLPDGTKVCHHCGCVASTDLGNYCPNCGSKNKVLAVVCTTCGHQLGAIPKGTDIKGLQGKITNKWSPRKEQNNAIPESPTWTEYAWATHTCIKKYNDFKGKASRKEYWYFRLWRFIIFAIWFIAMFLMANYTENDMLMLIITGVYGVFWLYTLTPLLSVTVRRLHDIGKSGWWYLIALIPVLGGITLLIWLTRPSLNQV